MENAIGLTPKRSNLTRVSDRLFHLTNIAGAFIAWIVGVRIAFFSQLWSVSTVELAGVPLIPAFLGGLLFPILSAVFFTSKEPESLRPLLFNIQSILIILGMAIWARAIVVQGAPWALFQLPLGGFAIACHVSQYIVTQTDRLRLASRFPYRLWVYLILAAGMLVGILAMVRAQFATVAGPTAFTMTALMIIVFAFASGLSILNFGIRKFFSFRSAVLYFLGIGLLIYMGALASAEATDVGDSYFVVRTVVFSLLVFCITVFLILSFNNKHDYLSTRRLGRRLIALLALIIVSISLFTTVNQNEIWQIGGTQFLNPDLRFLVVLLFTASQFVTSDRLSQILWAVLSASWGSWLVWQGFGNSFAILSLIATIPLLVDFVTKMRAATYWVAFASLILTLGHLAGHVDRAIINLLPATVIFVLSTYLSFFFAAPEGSRSEDVSGGIDGEQPSSSVRLLSRALQTPGLVCSAFAAIALGLGLLVVGANQASDAQAGKERSQIVVKEIRELLEREVENRELLGASLSRLDFSNVSSQSEFYDKIDPLALLITSNKTRLRWIPKRGDVFNRAYVSEGPPGLFDGFLRDLSEEQVAALNQTLEEGRAHWHGPFQVAPSREVLTFDIPLYDAETTEPTGVVSVALLDLRAMVLSKISAKIPDDTGVRITLEGSHSEYSYASGWNAELIDTITGSGSDLRTVFTDTYVSQEYQGALPIHIGIEAVQLEPNQTIYLLLQIQVVLFGAIIFGFSARTASKIWLSNRVKDLQLGQIFMGSEAAQILVGKSGNILNANGAAQALFEYSHSEFIELNVEMLIPQEFRERHVGLREGHFSAGCPRLEAQGRGAWGVTKSGNVFPVEVGLARIWGETEDVILVTVIDITKARAAEMAGLEFISNISHDLRTPLSVVTSSARMLEKSIGEGPNLRRLKRLRQASEVLNNLVTDVLDWTKIEAGELYLNIGPIDIRDVLQGLEEILGQVADEKGIVLVCDLPADITRFVMGDGPRLQQIIINLVSNAIKFTDKGEVRVRVSEVKPHTDEGVRIRFDVSDTGIGMTPEQLKNCFKRFSTSKHRNAGSGLGLSIVEQLAQLMDGNVAVQSEVGVGSTFTVELEFKRSSEPEINSNNSIELNKAYDEKSRLSHAHLLLVDDNDLILEELVETVEWSTGAKISTCANGMEAIEWLRRNKASVDLVLMDLNMPKMNGMDAIKLIRNDPDLKEIPVIAMTAGATKTSIESCLEAGMTDYITKPFGENELISLITKHIGKA
ncbi:ATP-binding protein [Altererythrobacter sp.]|uniref:ATP-binding response regulator n=1 Tax=Altererythrobacter sp. TaxID=1872480 RepID=UPI001B14EE9E|nr:ATP-binding protein [Altererythrobacter sp.]MBO6945189.1 response regulator [Altererythrobacter sp.]